MPNYKYLCENDHHDWDFVQSYKDRKKTITCKECGGDMWWEMGSNFPAPSGWPYYSDSMGVGEDQIKEAGDSLHKAGIDAEFRKDGALKINDRQHRNKVMGHLGMFDKDAGFGDRTPEPLEPIEPAETEFAQVEADQ